MSATVAEPIDKGVRLLVTGGRISLSRLHSFRVLTAVARYLIAEGRLTSLASLWLAEGAARGFDTHARDWAVAAQLGSRLCRFAIDHALDGDDPATCPKNRNQRMLDTFKPDLCLGAPGHGGTLDMMTRCASQGVPVWDVEVADPGDVFHVLRWPAEKGQRSTLLFTGKLA